MDLIFPIHANKKAISYESSFGIPVDSNLSECCHPGLFKIYHNGEIMSSNSSSKKTLAWTGRDSNPHPLGDNQVDYRYPTGPNPARALPVYQCRLEIINTVIGVNKT